ncbi:MAG: shikimate kinase [Chloroflexota bacterium]|nr:shikimate kinase [Chloroflexota bacterium]
MLGSPASIDRNLILTGYIGPAQVPVARRVAERLRMNFVDFQTELERRTGVDEDDLRARFGEARLKTLESEIVGDFALYRGAVIHVGGATLMRNGYLELLKTTGPVIVAVAALDAVLQRLHLTLGARYHDPRERSIAIGTIKDHWSIRRVVLGQDGIDEVDTTAMSDVQMVETIAAHWRERAAVLEWTK